MDFDQGLFQENPPGWGVWKKFFVFMVYVGGGGGGGLASFSFLGSWDQSYFSFLGGRCNAADIITFCKVSFVQNIISTPLIPGV